MSVDIEIKEIAEVAATSVATYSKRNYSLEVSATYPLQSPTLSEVIDKQVGIQDKKLYVIYGTLTVTFAGRDLKFHSVDSYTNIGKWLRQRLELPACVGSGVCTASVLTNDDRVAAEEEPIYLFDEKNSILQIKLLETDSERFYILNEGLVVGISKKTLSSIFISNLVIEN